MNFNYTFRLSKFLFHSLTLKRALHFLACNASQGISAIFSKPVVWGLPYASSIEPTTRCNLHCPECPTGREIINREKGDLQIDAFKKYVDNISYHTSYLTLYLQGEPFLNKNLPEMIRYASLKRIFTNISTNGHFITETKAREIIGAGLKKIIFSLDGTNQATYARYRQGGNFDHVIRGIENLVHARKLLSAKNPLIVIQFIVFRHNENEVPEILKLGKKLGVDKVEIKTAQHYNLNAENELITTKEKYNRYTKSTNGNWILKNVKRNGCERLWTTSVITWDGKVVACCYDKDGSFSFGDLKNSGLKQVWKGEKFMKFRETVLTNKISISICSNCGEK